MVNSGAAPKNLRAPWPFRSNGFVGALDGIADRVVRGGAAPACAVGCAALGRRGWAEETGGADEAIFDLASVTKPMTALAIARAGLRRRRLGELLPELSPSPLGAATLEDLLSHRVGLVDHLPLYLPVVVGESVDQDEALGRIAGSLREGLAWPPPHGGHPPVYSDLGYILAGVALARAMDVEDAGAAIERLVVARLDALDELGTIRGLAGRGVDLERVQPTEDVPWRGGVVRGAVHDENAWALTGTGGSGHAGMFGAVGAVVRFGEAVALALRGEGPLAAGDVGAWLVAARPGGSLAAGFDRKSEPSSAGTVCGPETVGHLGFTGTSLWIDLEAGAVVAVLSNRVHPTRNNARIRELRPEVHDALFRRAARSRV